MRFVSWCTVTTTLILFDYGKCKVYWIQKQSKNIVVLSYWPIWISSGVQTIWTFAAKVRAVTGNNDLWRNEYLESFFVCFLLSSRPVPLLSFYCNWNHLCAAWRWEARDGSFRHNWFQGKLAATSPQSSLWFGLFSRPLINGWKNSRRISSCCSSVKTSLAHCL